MIRFGKLTGLEVTAIRASLLVMAQQVDIIAPGPRQLGGAVDILGLQAGTGEVSLAQVNIPEVQTPQG